MPDRGEPGAVGLSVVGVAPEMSLPSVTSPRVAVSGNLDGVVGYVA